MSTFPTFDELALMWPMWIVCLIFGLIYFRSCYLDYWRNQEWLKAQVIKDRREQMQQTLDRRI